MEELQKDSAEIQALLENSTRLRVKEALTKLKAEVDHEISVLELKSRIAAEEKSAPPKRYLAELTEYAWDQSDKFVKLFISLDGVQNIDENNVSANFTEHSVNLLVSDLKGKDYGLTVNNLLMPINVEKSYRKVKTGMVAIYMKKRDEGNHWSHLTTIEKRLKQKQDEDLKNEANSGEDALVNIMKKMYNSGDSKTKQMIAKAWVESQEKARTGAPAGGDFNMDM